MKKNQFLSTKRNFYSTVLQNNVNIYLTISLSFSHSLSTTLSQ